MNWLQYFAGTAALIGLTVSAVVWLLGNARAIIWYRDDVQVISANTLTSAVVANRGDGEVFVSHLLFTMPGRTSNWIAPRLVFEKRIPPGQFARREFPKSKFDKGRWIRGMASPEFESLIARGANGDACVELVFMEQDDSLLRELGAAAGPTLNTFKVGGYLQYWGFGKKTPTLVPILGTGAIRECQA